MDLSVQGKRRSLPNARIMIHQPLGGAQGQAADIEIQAKEILFIRSLLNSYMAEYCDQPADKIQVQNTLVVLPIALCIGNSVPDNDVLGVFCL